MLLCMPDLSFFVKKACIEGKRVAVTAGRKGCRKSVKHVVK